ncbi:MAG: DUF4332 domain-containing protein [Jaaginema sp. PMC 1079.18]|nr:DUF4332 domain-containing protein [Jaaginema sp. PMC 1080.18]MEC4849457.1 DUF4332 domain-containing protein [Jaaginema sp. PMC 1079.18]MEC4865444.1 DUF4332 domain-containing protein [Jaaginema sp. PMC 1078.18]
MQGCNWSIEKLPGISDREIENLQAIGITTTQQLLQQTRNPENKNAIASQLQIHPQYVSKWIALADLARIPSVNCQYCGVILHCGIISISQLAQTPASHLHRQISRLYVSMMQRQDLTPPVDRVQVWVKEAQSFR